jgi:large subunit ribosomal protein L29
VPLKKERDEFRQKTLDELAIALRDVKRELFEIRTNIATRKEEDNNRSRILKRRVARILTVMNEKESAGGEAAPAAASGRAGK